ncbi:speckle-type POZ protein B-like [Brevipalpus obovatus]|uniref:speckle-type POZ protein B-like n=1 Tax=Brevipalpus obovatus TaxID=246614 RepID=UPI003D9ECD3B
MREQGPSNQPRIRLSRMANSSTPRRSQNLTPLSQSVTNLPVSKFNHLWVIKYFPYIPSEEPFICCPNFSPPNSKDKWFMKLRPKSVDEQTGIEYIGIHLFLRQCEDRSKQQVRAKYVISVLDAENDPRYTGECSRIEGRIFKAGTEGHGYKLLAPRELLLNQTNNMLGPEDSLRILCEITMFGEMTSSIVNTTSTTDLHPHELLLQNSIASDMASFFSSGSRSTDVILEGRDGVQVRGHKLILAARSKVIGAMFEHECKEKSENKIEIKDIDGAVLSEMVQFIYSDQVKNIEEFAADLLIVAEKYDLPRLKRLCEQHLATKLSYDTSGNILALADICNSIELKEKALDFVIANPSKVIHSESWDNHLKKRPFIFKEAFELLARKRTKTN